ncbi:YfiT family bacillithiol transferase [Metabacillus sp. HB246100]|uniref:YfiT family bacillithiol transferase n=1 Tax=Bacillus weihaiensis TaxID=1547283 RepID=UPI002357565C|nr:bacillithiol transferase BstA [Bacillus weihaiensis]
MSDSLKYPIGKFTVPTNVTRENLNIWIEDIERMPTQLEQVITTLSESQLNCSYRPGGWTVHQIVHHLADSHMNSFIRFKLALTEELPTIKPYDETIWANLADVQKTSLFVSLELLIALHVRWTSLLKTMSDADFQRCFYHPELKKTISLAENLALYSWHGKHHIEHIKLVLVH